MENKHLVLISIFIFAFFSCDEKEANSKVLETPFITVVKLISAEQSLHFEEAMHYIDVVQVYTKLGSENPIEDWKKTITFQYNIGKDKKFTNEFGYYNYDIEETIKADYAEICFKEKNDSSMKKIIYGLERRQNKWIVISISYSN